GFAEHGFFLLGDAHGDVEVLDFFAGLGLGLFELGEFVGLTGGLGFAFGEAAGEFGGLFAGLGGVGAGGVELFAQLGGGLPGFGGGSVEPGAALFAFGEGLRGGVEPAGELVAAGLVVGAGELHDG